MLAGQLPRGWPFYSYKPETWRYGALAPLACDRACHMHRCHLRGSSLIASNERHCNCPQTRSSILDFLRHLCGSLTNGASPLANFSPPVGSEESRKLRLAELEQWPMGFLMRCRRRAAAVVFFLQRRPKESTGKQTSAPTEIYLDIWFVAVQTSSPKKLNVLMIYSSCPDFFAQGKSEESERESVPV